MAKPSVSPTSTAGKPVSTDTREPNESRSLATLGDKLLPKLLSEELNEAADAEIVL